MENPVHPMDIVALFDGSVWQKCLAEVFGSKCFR